MSDLQIGLLVIGAAAVAGVLIYNRLQERSTRRQAEQAFGSKHADVLLDEPQARREPTLELSVEPSPEHPTPPRADPRVDYVMEIDGASVGVLRAHWTALERRFAGRASLTQAGARAAHATLQMVNRSGVVPQAEIEEFRSQVEGIAARSGASVSAPPVGEALAAAQALDRACADVDVQIALHVLGAAEARLQAEGFSVAKRPDGVTLLLDVPRTPDLVKSYAAMARTARALGGRVVDDNGNAVDERALSAIGVEVEALRLRLAEVGIEPGSPLAQRLFS
jgi:ZipA, C-terminal FtsZ-binding domain